MRLPRKDIHFLNYLTYTGVNGTISQLYNYNLFFNFRPKYPWLQHFDVIGVRISEITTCSKYNKNEICYIETAVHDPRSDWRKKSSTISGDCLFRAGKWNKSNHSLCPACLTLFRSGTRHVKQKQSFSLSCLTLFPHKTTLRANCQLALKSWKFVGG